MLFCLSAQDQRITDQFVSLKETNMMNFTFERTIRDKIHVNPYGLHQVTFSKGDCLEFSALALPQPIASLMTQKL